MTTDANPNSEIESFMTLSVKLPIRIRFDLLTIHDAPAEIDDMRERERKAVATLKELGSKYETVRGRSTQYPFRA
jgi:hypothetical protein